MFDPPNGWQAKRLAAYTIDAPGLADIAAGRIDFFGNAPLEVGHPVDWHRDPKTGLRAPLSFGKTINYRDDRLVGDIKVLWELGRHQHLIPLAAAYAHSGDSRYRDAVAEQIDGWCLANPYGLGVHWCSALEPALRLIAWSFIQALIAVRDGTDGIFPAMRNQQRFGTAIYQQTHFISRFLSRHSSANNHLIGELTGIWVATCTFDMGAWGARWARRAQRELEREAAAQVFADGVNKEQAAYYHLWVLEYFLVAWIVGESCARPFSAAFRNRILAMAAFLRAIAPPGGTPPQIGDADDGFVTRFDARWPTDPYGQVLEAVDAVFGDDPPDDARAIGEKAYWYRMAVPAGANRDGGSASADVTYPRIFPEGGYAVLGDPKFHLVFDAGPLGYPSIAAHGHADALSLCLAVDGAWWLVDPGTFAYHSDPVWRSYFRGTRAHNTLTVDDHDQSLIGGPFLWLRHAKARLREWALEDDGSQWARGSHDGYMALGVVHDRTVEIDSEQRCLVVRDRIDCVPGNQAATVPHDCALHFHFAPHLVLSARDTGTGGANHPTWSAVDADTGSLMTITVDGHWQWDIVRGDESAPLGWYSGALGYREPATTLRGRCQLVAPAILETRFEIK